MLSETEDEIARLRREQALLTFGALTPGEALDLGVALMNSAQARNHPVAVGVDLGEQRLFRACLPGTSADHQTWLERKFSAVRRFWKSSLELELIAGRDADFALERGLDPSVYALVGGAVPIMIGSIPVGTIGIAGLQSREDHDIVVQTLSDFLNRS